MAVVRCSAIMPAMKKWTNNALVKDKGASSIYFVVQENIPNIWTGDLNVLMIIIDDDV